MPIWYGSQNLQKQILQTRVNLGLTGKVVLNGLYLDREVHPFSVTSVDGIVVARHSNLPCARETAYERKAYVLDAKGNHIAEAAR